MEGPDGRYWCRQCLRSGDAIQFCRDFMGMDFPSSFAKIGRQPTQSSKSMLLRPKKDIFVPKSLITPPEQWCQNAYNFVEKSHQYLLLNPHLINQNKNRGLTIRNIIDFQLGWNATNIFEQRESWGLSSTANDGGSNLLCLPQGIVIPSLRENVTIRVKIRRHNWKPDDEYPKYQIIAGGMT